MNIKNIIKKYVTAKEEIIALNEVSYQFEKGKFYAIMGHSGSGKSTLIRILGLLENFTQGSYFIDDKDVSKFNDIELSKIRMNKIGFVFQDYYLDSTLKAIENVILPMLINPIIPKKEQQNRAIKLLKMVNVANRANHYPNEMSGGEQQRVCLARALANNPDIILADEPTGNLDEANEELIFQLLKQLSLEGKCIIVVSHSNNVKKYADIVINLQNGKILL